MCLSLMELYDLDSLQMSSSVQEHDERWKDLTFTSCCCSANPSWERPLKICQLLVQQSIISAIEQKHYQRILCLDLLTTLVKKGLISTKHFLRGIERVIKQLPDLSLDVPHADQYYAFFLGRLLGDKTLSLDWLVQFVIGDQPSDDKIPKLLTETLIELTKYKDYQTMFDLWARSDKSVQLLPHHLIKSLGASVLK